MAIAGAVAAVLITQVTASLPVVLAGALGVAMLAGLVNGVLVAWAGIQPIVATLILMVAGRGLALLIAGGRTITFHAPAFEYLGKGYLLGLPFAAVLAVACYVATHLAVRRTAAAWFIEAVGDNETASRFAGLAAARVKCLVYVFAGLCAGLAGVLATANIGTADSYRTGEYMELDAIFAVVVGGTPLLGGRFSLAGSLVGALLLQTLTTTMYSLGVPPAVAPIPKAVVVVGVCLLQSPKFRAWTVRCFTRRAAA
jgi:simple sugar transport system permease protein